MQSAQKKQKIPKSNQEKLELENEKSPETNMIEAEFTDHKFDEELIPENSDQIKSSMKKEQKRDNTNKTQGSEIIKEKNNKKSKK